MRATVRKQYGLPHIVKVINLPQPRPMRNQVLIKVYATTVNRTDCAALLGSPKIYRLFAGVIAPRRIILGTDFAGVVEECGSGVTHFKVGDRVWGFDDMGCSSQAEYMVFAQDKGIAHVPQDLSFEQAAASIEGMHYAINMLNKTTLVESQKVLINGATGAIGSALLQLLKDKHIYVRAVCNTKNTALMKTLGADKVIDYTQHDILQDDDVYDGIFDFVGALRFEQCRHLLHRGGIFCSSELGPGGQYVALALRSAIVPLTDKMRVVFPYPYNIKRSITMIARLIQEKRFTPVIDEYFSLDTMGAAYEYVNAGYKTGNVIARIHKQDNI